MISSHLVPYLVFIGNICNVQNDVCSETRNESQCDPNYKDHAMSCAGGLHGADNIRKIILSTLILCDWPDEYFNPAVLLEFPDIQRFTLLKSSVRQIAHDFYEYPKLKELNISYNEIEYLTPTVFLKLESLTVLDLRYNKLRQFDHSFLTGLLKLNDVFLFGNQWHCNDSGFSWIVQQNNSAASLIKDVDSLMCNGPMFKNKPLKQVMSIHKTLNSECIEISNHCSCTLDHIVRVANGLRPMITVNCSHQNLKVLPPNLPNFTSTLIMKGNSISELDPFINDEKYSNLLNVYLDYNNISSINILAGSSWLMFTCRALSLRGNKLTEVPVYALEHAFLKNRNIGNFFLSENPWKCDCIFTPNFKDFLANYRMVIKDAENVRCAHWDKEGKSQPPILSLSRNKICHESSVSRISALNILNICMAILLGVILCDFIYNYFMYKKYGQLPWIANKLP